MKHAMETGYAHNVTKFAILVDGCASFGPAYNPSRPDLRLDAMRSTLDFARQNLEAYQKVMLDYTTARGVRKTLFLGFGKRITRINNAFKLTPVSDAVKAQVNTLANRLRGIRSSAAAVAVPEATEVTGVVDASHTRVHTSFGALLELLKQLVILLASVPEYAPNEADLATPALVAWKNELVAAHEAVFSTHTAVMESRRSRDQTLLARLYALAGDAKVYVRSVFGAGSSQNSQLVKLVFKDAAS